jgi:hypothetical protein
VATNVIAELTKYLLIVFFVSILLSILIMRPL